VFVGMVVLRRDGRGRSSAPDTRTEGVEPAPARAGFVGRDPAPPTPPRRVYSAGVPVIAAPVVSAMGASVASTG
jgi:hypothetical protein